MLIRMKKNYLAVVLVTPLLVQSNNIKAKCLMSEVDERFFMDP
jgi:hypothetical protein